MGTGFRSRGFHFRGRPARAHTHVAKWNGESLGMANKAGDKFFCDSRPRTNLDPATPMAFPPTPALTTDCVAFDARGRVLLIRRKNPPFEGGYALPGGFVDLGETVEDACRRELKEETGIEAGPLRLIGVYSDPQRDPRGHTCSIAFLTRVRDAEPTAGDDAAAAEWIADWRGLTLAFDHGLILRDAERVAR